MSDVLSIRPIGIARTPFLDKASAPRQPAAAREVEGVIELYPSAEMLDALEEIAGWSRLWILFWFHEAEGFRPKVQPPRSEQGKIGVLATRSPHRPNPIGLSALRLIRVDGCNLHVKDVDLIDGTPILDVKPYVPYTDAFPEESDGWLADPKEAFGVIFSELATVQLEFLKKHGVDLRARVETALALGPKPHAYRRIRSRGDGSELAVKEWRIDFHEHDGQMHVDRVRSGYRPKALFERTDLELHHQFVAQFGGA